MRLSAIGGNFKISDFKFQGIVGSLESEIWNFTPSVFGHFEKKNVALLITLIHGKFKQQSYA
jgi:hypothetical protein